MGQIRSRDKDILIPENIAEMIFCQWVLITELAESYNNYDPSYMENMEKYYEIVQLFQEYKQKVEALAKRCE